MDSVHPGDASGPVMPGASLVYSYSGVEFGTFILGVYARFVRQNRPSFSGLGLIVAVAVLREPKWVSKGC